MMNEKTLIPYAIAAGLILGGCASKTERTYQPQQLTPQQLEQARADSESRNDRSQIDYTLIKGSGEGIDTKMYDSIAQTLDGYVKHRPVHGKSTFVFQGEDGSPSKSTIDWANQPSMDEALKEYVMISKLPKEAGSIAYKEINAPVLKGIINYDKDGNPNFDTYIHQKNNFTDGEVCITVTSDNKGSSTITYQFDDKAHMLDLGFDISTNAWLGGRTLGPAGAALGAGATLAYVGVDKVRRTIKGEKGITEVVNDSKFHDIWFNKGTTDMEKFAYKTNIDKFGVDDLKKESDEMVIVPYKGGTVVLSIPANQKTFTEVSSLDNTVKVCLDMAGGVDFTEMAQDLLFKIGIGEIGRKIGEDYYDNGKAAPVEPTPTPTPTPAPTPKPKPTPTPTPPPGDEPGGPAF